MNNEEIIRAVEGHCRDGLLYAANNVVGPLTRVGYLAKCLETILWECGRLDSGPCSRCDGDGLAHGSDRPFEWSGPGSYPGKCPVCKGSGRSGAATNADDGPGPLEIVDPKDAYHPDSDHWGSMVCPAARLERDEHGL